MAKAPRPGASQRKAQEEASKRVLQITITREIETTGGRTIPTTHSLAAGILPMRERVICRRATGLPIEAFTDSDGGMGMDSIAVIWWLARRMNGEATLTWEQAAGEWPLDLTIDEIDVDVITPAEVSDDPES